MQLGHAALEAGIKNGPSPDGHPSLVYLAVRDKNALEEQLHHFSSIGFRVFEFHEPYMDWGLTAFAVEPITTKHRHLFKHLKLWRSNNE